MEVMGEEVSYSNEKAPPLKLTLASEVFNGLTRLSRPVELYYYPNELHEIGHPQARLASLERNLDWYRWWLEGIRPPQRTASTH